MARIIALDGAQGEGGGQILRSALSLSMITGQPFEMSGIRAGRAKPGLLRQHLTAVRAATEICGAQVNGDELGSQQLRLRRGRFAAASTVSRLAARAVVCWCCKPSCPRCGLLTVHPAWRFTAGRIIRPRPAPILSAASGSRCWRGWASASVPR